MDTSTGLILLLNEQEALSRQQQQIKHHENTDMPPSNTIKKGALVRRRGTLHTVTHTHARTQVYYDRLSCSSSVNRNKLWIAIFQCRKKCRKWCLEVLSRRCWFDTVIFHAIQRRGVERFLFQLGDMRERYDYEASQGRLNNEQSVLWRLIQVYSYSTGLQADPTV